MPVEDNQPQVLPGIVVEKNINPYDNLNIPVIETNITSLSTNTNTNDDGYIIQTKRNGVIFLSITDMIFSLFNFANGFILSSIIGLCALYGYLGARDLNYKYIQIYANYLIFTLVLRLLFILNSYMILNNHKYIYNNHGYNITYINNDKLIHNYTVNFYINIFLFTIQGYICYYANSFKNALKNFTTNTRHVIGIV